MIKRATLQDVSAVSALAAQLWPEQSADELAEGFDSVLTGAEDAVFLFCADETPVGFAHCSLRHDYVEGTDSTPVGYLEGIFVLPEYRQSGVAGALLSACEHWAREMGCREFASDCELTNDTSALFHKKLGFTEVNRIICFTKKL